MPRVSAAHEQQVRDRIVSAAVRVFSDKGYHGSTVADVVRASGLSVGAIYTYFPSKEALFLQSCDLLAGRGLEELAVRLEPIKSTSERLAAAIAYYVETIDDFDGDPGQVSLVRAWAEADGESGVREMLGRRRERLVQAAMLLLQPRSGSAQVRESGTGPGVLAAQTNDSLRSQGRRQNSAYGLPRITFSYLRFTILKEHRSVRFSFPCAVLVFFCKTAGGLAFPVRSTSPVKPRLRPVARH